MAAEFYCKKCGRTYSSLERGKVCAEGHDLSEEDLKAKSCRRCGRRIKKYFKGLCCPGCGRPEGAGEWINL